MPIQNHLDGLPKEKLRIIDCKGNILVTANPGTGKTKLLAHKYIDLAENGSDPEKILCLTFTKKAKKELEDRIMKLIEESEMEFDLSKLNVSTFHSFALDHLDGDEIISSNLLRYSIYKYLKENEVLNYGDNYLIETIVPKMENLLRYLKSFGIMPDSIDINKVKAFLKGNDKYEKEQLDKFAEYFVEIFRHYEKTKEGKGMDYADLLIEFLKLKNPPVFDYVLVDELQDVNKMEADVALKCAKKFVAVGDKKQAIFGFQGGSIINFKKFSSSTPFVLSDNFRSSNEILRYAKEYFVSKTEDSQHKSDLENLKSAKSKSGKKPIIYDIDKEDSGAVVAELVKKLEKNGKKTAVIVRNNSQIISISNELKKRGIGHSSTFFSASAQAKDGIINFLRGVLSRDVQHVKNAMFTPFFPVSIQDAFEIADNAEIDFEGMCKKCTDFQELIKFVKTTEDINTLFERRIIPVSIAYGKEYLLAALNIQEACMEAMKVLDKKDLKSLLNYISSSDLLADGSDAEGHTILTTVHKAKGKEFDYVIYVPRRPRDAANFQDEIVKAILKSHGINAEEELEEESLRIDFVAFTRAEEELHIITDRPEDYINEFSDKGEISVNDIETFDLSERMKRAYNLFVNKDYDKAKSLIEIETKWLVDFVVSHFKEVDHISFSSLTDNPYDYLQNNILSIKEFSEAADLGSRVHSLAESLARGKDVKVEKDLQPYKNNIEKILKEILKEYPEVFDAEKKVSVSISKIVSTDETIRFIGKIDAIFKNGNNYLIVDWKTNKKEDDAAKHRQQLELYRRALSVSQNIPMEKIKVAIGFIGLREMINNGKIECKLDNKQPAPTAFETISKKIKRVIDWKKDPKLFLEELAGKDSNTILWRSVIEQYNSEKGNRQIQTSAS